MVNSTRMYTQSSHPPKHLHTCTQAIHRSETRAREKPLPHSSTFDISGVLRLVLELQAEKITRTLPAQYGVPPQLPRPSLPHRGMVARHGRKRSVACCGCASSFGKRAITAQSGNWSRSKTRPRRRLEASHHVAHLVDSGLLSRLSSRGLRAGEGSLSASAESSESPRV